jgi:hypothetical protein
MAFPHDGKKMKKGETLNPNGRPRKYVSLLKEQGYKRSEIDDCIRAMLSMDLSELKDVFDNDKATILEKTIAKAMVKSLEKGTLYSIETLLSRTYGQPKQEIEQTVIEKPIFTGIDLSVKSNSNPTEDKSKED